MRLKLRTKFVIPTIVLFLVGMILSSYITFVTSINALESSIYEQINQTAESIATNLSEWVTRNKLDVSRWARQDIFRDAIPDSFLGEAARKAAFPMMVRLLDEYKFYESIFLCNLHGEIIVASSKMMVGREVADEPFFTVAAGGAVYISNIMPSALNGAPVFVISAPVGLPEAVSGVLVGIVKLGYFTSSSVDDVRFGKTGYAFIVDANGNVVAHPDKNRIFTRDPGSLFRGLKESTTNKRSERRVSDVISVVKKDKQLGLTIGITAPVEEILAPAKKVRQRVILVTIAVSVLVVTMVTIFVTRFVTAPIQKFVRGMKTVTAGNLDDEIHMETTDEFSSMAKSFNEMAKALKESKLELKQTYQQLVQKEKMAALGELTARIAHEIKNPLGIIKGSAQILAEESEGPEIKSEVAQYIIEEVNYLSLRIQELLAHAKPMLLNLEPADLNQVLEERIQFWESQRADLRNVTIVRKFEPELPSLNLDRRLIKQLVMNMIINACEAMPGGGVLTVTTAIAKNGRKGQSQEFIESEGVTLIFEDIGSGISQQDLPKIFDPFFTTKERGTGLGLSTVYRILEKHEAKIQVKSAVGHGTCFIITFPRTMNTEGHNAQV